MFSPTTVESLRIRTVQVQMTYKFWEYEKLSDKLVIDVMSFLCIVLLVLS